MLWEGSRTILFLLVQMFKSLSATTGDYSNITAHWPHSCHPPPPTPIIHGKRVGTYRLKYYVKRYSKSTSKKLLNFFDLTASFMKYHLFGYMTISKLVRVKTPKNSAKLDYKHLYSPLMACSFSLYVRSKYEFFLFDICCKQKILPSLNNLIIPILTSARDISCSPCLDPHTSLKYSLQLSSSWPLGSFHHPEVPINLQFWLHLSWPRNLHTTDDDGDKS